MQKPGTKCRRFRSKMSNYHNAMPRDSGRAEWAYFTTTRYVTDPPAPALTFAIVKSMR